MRILMLDLDTLRPDHLGCYGYKRNTSPNIDWVASQGVTFDNYYCPNAPCLPSRASLVSGKFGLITGIVGHGDTAADMRIEGPGRDFHSHFSRSSLFQNFLRGGFRTVSVSAFAERHSAYWFNAGITEAYMYGKGGGYNVETIMPTAIDWIERNGKEDNWFLHVHTWDPHTPFRVPNEYGNPYKDAPLPNNWITQDILDEHLKAVVPHSANEWADIEPKFPGQPGTIKTLKDVKQIIDNYDTSIKYMDDYIGTLFDSLKKQGVFDEDLAIIITSDHGENYGELGIYAEHATADEITCHIPMIIKWPNGQKGLHDKSFHTNVDLAPTVCDLFNVNKHGDYYDGTSYAETLLNGKECGSDHVVLTQCAHIVQRGARWDNYVYIHTFHGGYSLLDEEMLFDLKKDPHETTNIAKAHPELVAKGKSLIFDWQNKYMAKSPYTVDPLWTVYKEGGAFHAKPMQGKVNRLRACGREEDAQKLIAKYPKDAKKNNII